MVVPASFFLFIHTMQSFKQYLNQCLFPKITRIVLKSPDTSSYFLLVFFFTRHLIYGLNTTSAYKGAAFSPIVMAIDVATDTNDWTSVRQAVGYTTLGIQAATGIVNDAQSH